MLFLSLTPHIRLLHSFCLSSTLSPSLPFIPTIHSSFSPSFSLVPFLFPFPFSSLFSHSVLQDGGTAGGSRSGGLKDCQSQGVAGVRLVSGQGTGSGPSGGAVVAAGGSGGGAGSSAGAGVGGIWGKPAIPTSGVGVVLTGRPNRQRAAHSCLISPADVAERVARRFPPELASLDEQKRCWCVYGRAGYVDSIIRLTAHTICVHAGNQYTQPGLREAVINRFWKPRPGSAITLAQRRMVIATTRFASTRASFCGGHAAKHFMPPKGGQKSLDNLVHSARDDSRVLHSARQPQDLGSEQALAFFLTHFLDVFEDIVTRYEKRFNPLSPGLGGLTGTGLAYKPSDGSRSRRRQFAPEEVNSLDETSLSFSEVDILLPTGMQGSSPRGRSSMCDADLQSLTALTEASRGGGGGRNSVTRQFDNEAEDEAAQMELYRRGGRKRLSIVNQPLQLTGVMATTAGLSVSETVGGSHRNFDSDDTTHPHQMRRLSASSIRQTTGRLSLGEPASPLSSVIRIGSAISSPGLTSVRGTTRSSSQEGLSGSAPFMIGPGRGSCRLHRSSLSGQPASSMTRGHPAGKTKGRQKNIFDMYAPGLIRTSSNVSPSWHREEGEKAWKQIGDEGRGV
ncbi:unnamed protein product [Protopolystoma xenopodis]|uniref:Uncharacterized protein n=1 Tax=Protopolystoma xenopodis TaxID=117903 RepID=A0A3S5AX16_9PLAT|nr:unnamed protein product [Protopolystoma xenopodis]